MSRVTVALQAAEEPKIRLFDIQSAFVELMQARMDAEDIEEPVEREATLAAVDLAIKQYVDREVQKVDGIRAILKRVLPAAIASAKAERDYQQRRLRSLEAAEARLLDLVKSVMIAFDRKRLEGSTGYFLHKGNGGQLPLVIDQWDADREKWLDVSTLPDDYKLVQIRMPMQLFHAMLHAVNIHAREDVKLICSSPDVKKIRATLEGVCQYCGRERGSTGSPNACSVCGGIGGGGVPGARLNDRGTHVEVK